MINLLREGEDLRPQFNADIIEVELIFNSDQANRQPEMAKPPRPTNSVQVRLRRPREVKVDDDIDGLHVNATRAEVRGDEVPAVPVPELVEHLVSVLLGHPGMDVERRVPHLRDRLCEPLDPLQRVAEYHRLVDPEVVKERAEAVQFLPFLHKRVVLSDTFECELLHKVDSLGFRHVPELEIPHGLGERCGEQHNLSLLGQDGEQLLHHVRERPRQESVRLVQHKHRHAIEVDNLLFCEVEDAPWCRHDDVHRAIEPHNVVLKRGTPGGRHDLRLGVAPEVLADLRRLEHELAGGDKDEDLDLVERGVHAVQGRDEVRGRLPGAVLGTGDDVLALQSDGDGVLLDGGGVGETALVDAAQNFFFECKIFELGASCPGYIFGLVTGVFGRLLE